MAVEVIPANRIAGGLTRFANKILFDAETYYRQYALLRIEQHFGKLKEGEDYFVEVDGRPTGMAGIRSAKLGRGKYIRASRKGNSANLFEAYQAAMQAILATPLNRTPMTRARMSQQQRYGSFKNLFEVYIDGQLAGPPRSAQDLATASEVLIVNRAIHAASLQRIYDSHLFYAGAKAANAVQGISATLFWGDPNYFRQVERNGDRYAVPCVRIGFTGTINLREGRRGLGFAALPNGPRSGIGSRRRRQRRRR